MWYQVRADAERSGHLTSPCQSKKWRVQNFSPPQFTNSGLAVRRVEKTSTLTAAVKKLGKHTLKGLLQSEINTKWKLDQAAAGSRIFKTKEELNLRINVSCSWQILCWIDNDPPTSIMPWLHYIWQTARLRTRVIWQQNSSIAEGGGCSNVSYRLQIRAWRFRNISLKQSKQHTYLQTLIFSHQSSIYQISATVVFDNCVTRAPSPRNAQMGHLDLVFSQSLILINGHLSRQWRLPEFISNIVGDYDNKITNYLLVTSTRALRRYSSPPGPSFLSYFIFLCFTRP